MAFNYAGCWLPAASCLYIDTIFHTARYCVCALVLCFKIDFTCWHFKRMASMIRAGYRITNMSKYYWSYVVAFGMTSFVVLYYCFSETLLTDDDASMKVFGHIEFDSQSSNTDRISEHSDPQKELKPSKCRHLHEIATDMLYNGDKIRLPFETNNTRWRFHNRGDLEDLKDESRRWSQPRFDDPSPWSFENYGETKSRELKAKKYFITFACKCCTKSKVRAIKSARDPGGFDFTTVHGVESLSKKFQYTHLRILKQRRGCGYWLWKPYVILKTLIENMSDNDLLMYQDAGSHLIRDAGPLLKLSQDLDSGIVLFHTEFLENVYTKRDAFVLMDMDDVRVYNSHQRLASFLILRKSCQTLQFVMEWLAYASDHRILTDVVNQMGKPNLPTFRENRHDQTVLSLLSKRWQLIAFRDPSQYGNMEQKLMYAFGPYKQLINHTRDTS